MILEVALLTVKEGQTAAFETAFATAQQYIAQIPGYHGHQLQRCLENSHQYLLLVHWTSLEAHTIDFRQAPQYQIWRELLHHFYDPFPTVEHYEMVQLPSLP